MNDTERHRLRFGPYTTPTFRYGETVSDEARDCDVLIVGLSSGRIPWPLGRRKKAGARGLVVYGQLAEAIRCESNQAVCYWWGVTTQTVTKWRKALDVGPTTEGTSRLRREYAFEEPLVEARKKAHAKANDPDRCRKIADARRGRKRPPHVIAAMRKGRTGKPHDAEARAKMSEAHRRRGTRPPKAGRAWVPAEDELVRTRTASEVATLTGRSMHAVYTRRSQLQVPDGRKTRFER